MATCERCHQQILDPADEVQMVEVIREQTFGGEPSEPTDGRTVHFHRDHVPEDPGHYRPVDS